MESQWSLSLGGQTKLSKLYLFSADMDNERAFEDFQRGFFNIENAF